MTHAELIAKQLNVKPSQVDAVIRLLDEGNTVPFIARYRKEKTGEMKGLFLPSLFFEEIKNPFRTCYPALFFKPEFSPEILFKISFVISGEDILAAP